MRKPRQSTVLSDSQATDRLGRTENDSGNDEQEDGPNRDPEVGEDVPETVQEVWDALREEFYEHIEQLPLSLRRSLSLIGEQDSEVQEYQTELLPIIRTYVKLRQSGTLESNGLGKGGCAESSSAAAYTGVSDGDGGKQEANSLTFGIKMVERLSPRQNSTPNKPANSMSEPQSIRSDRSRRPLATPSGRSQALRETDASVPKSVPFPSREKPESSNELLPRISFLMSEILRASEEKVGLANAAYDTVDRHIRALDVAVQSLGGSIPESGEGRPPFSPPAREESDVGDTSIANGEGEKAAAQLPREEQRTAPRTRKSAKRDAQSTTGKEPEVDPNEPRYCYCNQVSYGEMIGCDNRDCAREWFHLHCVGLTAPPKGKWYCKECEEGLQRNKKRRVH